MTYVPHTIPTPVEGFMSRLTDQQLVDGVRVIDAMKRADVKEEHLQSRIWLLDEFENRHPEIHDQVLSFFDDDAPDVEMEYVEILVSVTPGVN